MSDHPFHVASEFFALPHQSRPETLLPQRPSLPDEACASPRPGSRRRKLWELPHKTHCPIIGVCFGVDELRSLMAKSLQFPRDTGDFALHTTAVGACETRTPLSEVLHKRLEKRFQLSVRIFAKAREAEALHRLWRNAVISGDDLPAALWASWTHPACNALLEQEIYADIHMIQHQLGTGTRAELSMLKAQQAESAGLRHQLDAARREVEAQRAEKSRETQLLGQRIAELRIELAGKDAYAANLLGQIDALRQSLPELKERRPWPAAPMMPKPKPAR
jgi:hypothetical protein